MVVKVVKALIVVATMAAPMLASGQEPYPSRPIKLIVSFTPGGGADLTARTLALKMGEQMKQPVVVENRPGGNGLVGAGAVAQSTPDGYTILLTDRGALGVNPSLYKTLPYDPLRDFAYIGIATVAPYVLVSNPRLPVVSLNDLLEYARANPGKVNYASFGIASMAHLNLEAFKARLGVDLLHVPYEGAGPAVQAVVSGDAGVTISSPAAVLGFVRDGRLHAIAIGAPHRSTLLPNVPTMDESGVGGDLLATTYFALAAPSATPPGVVARLYDEMKRALSAADVRERLTNAGLEPVGMGGQGLLGLVRLDIPRFRKLVTDIGIQPE